MFFHDDRFNKRSNEVFTDIVHTILVLSGCKSQRNDIKTGIQTYCFQGMIQGARLPEDILVVNTVLCSVYHHYVLNLLLSA